MLTGKWYNAHILSLFFKAFGEQVQSYRESNVGVLDEVNRNIRFEIAIATDINKIHRSLTTPSNVTCSLQLKRKRVFFCKLIGPYLRSRLQMEYDITQDEPRLEASSSPKTTIPIWPRTRFKK